MFLYPGATVIQLLFTSWKVRLILYTGKGLYAKLSHVNHSCVIMDKQGYLCSFTMSLRYRFQRVY